MEDQHMVQALSSDTAQQAFTDRLGAFRMRGCGEYLDAACCCHSSETGPELAIMITKEGLWRLSRRSRLPQVSCGPARREEIVSRRRG